MLASGGAAPVSGRSVMPAKPETTMLTKTRGIAAFDLDGTLLRGPTVCEVLAKPLGRLKEMRRFEAFIEECDIAAARVEMARWYDGQSVDELNVHLRNAEWAPGAHEAVQKLQSAGVQVAVVSVTWSFAVQWFAEQLNVSNYLGTQLLSSGEINHVWGRDKARFVRGLASNSGVPPHRIAAIGDSRGDIEMLKEARLPFFIGTTVPFESDQIIHLPQADLRVVAERILQEWAA